MTDAPVDERPASVRGLRRDVVVVALLAGLLFLPGLGNRDLWNPDEPRYTEVAREMALFDQWLVPHLNGRVYAEKPPLLFWAIHLSGLLLGRLGPAAARLPSALAAIGTVCLSYRIGRRLASRRSGLLAAAITATSARLLWQGRVGQIDMLLVFLVTLAVWFWVRADTEERPAFSLLFFATAGLATVAKGPVGLVPPLLSIVAFLLAVGERSKIRHLRLGRGLLLWAAVVLAWLVPAALEGGREYFETVVFKQNVTRYADPWHHFQPPWYYLGVIPADFFPWSFLLPSALVLGWKRLAGRERRAWAFGLAWMAVTVLFFSLSPAKRTVYVLTMYPGMALLVAVVLDHLATTLAPLRTGDAVADAPALRPLVRLRRWLLWPLGGVAALAVLALVALPFVVREHPREVALLGPRTPGLLALLVAFLATGAAGGWWLARRGRVTAAAGALATGMGALGLTVVLALLPRFQPLKSNVALAGTFTRLASPDAPYAIYPRLDPPIVFYTERFAEEIVGEEELRTFASRPGEVWLFIERDDLARVVASGGPLPLVEIDRDRDPEDGYVLLASPGAL